MQIELKAKKPKTLVKMFFIFKSLENLCPRVALTRKNMFRKLPITRVAVAKLKQFTAVALLT
jgi:hypothetical protein